MSLSTLLARLNRATALAVAGLIAAASALSAQPEPREVEPTDDEYESFLHTPHTVLSADAGSYRVNAARRSGSFVELPTRTVAEWTPDQVRAALRSADDGSLERPADLVEAIMGDDRVQGVLSTRTHGLLGLPMQFYGADEQVSCLEGTTASAGQPATPGDWAKMHPEPELAQLAAWGILLGVGLGERVPMADREIGQRDTPRLKIWHPRWLRQEQSTGKWFLTTADGIEEIHPGDGRWILYMPYGSSRPWAHGAWRPIAFAWCLKQFALHDRARHSEVQGGAARVGIAPQGAKEASRKKFLSDLRSMGRNAAFVLPDGYDYKVVEAAARTYEIYGAQIDWADRAIAIVLAGQFVTTEGTKGFSNGQIHSAIRYDLIRFTAESLGTCLSEQSVSFWSMVNFGSVDLAPWVRWDVSIPEDKKTTAEAYGALGDALTKLSSLTVYGKRPAALELCSKFGLPLEDLPASMTKAPSIALAPTDLAVVIFVNEARASAGVGPMLLADGSPDPDGKLTLAAYKAKQEAAKTAALAPVAPAPATPGLSALPEAA